MEINLIKGKIATVNVDALVISLFEDIKQLTGLAKTIDTSLEGGLVNLIKDGEITGKLGEMTLIHTLGKIQAGRIIIIGLGKKEKFTAESIRYGIGEVSRLLVKLKIKTAATIPHGIEENNVDAIAFGEAVAEGMLLGMYQFTRYKNNGKKIQESNLRELQILEDNKSKASLIKQGIKRGTILANATVTARDMGNEPANIMNPTEMAKQATKIAKQFNLDLEIFDKNHMEKLGMGSLLAVSAGSNQPPKLIILRYKGDLNNQENNLAICGKGITFDSGGISIKPAGGMGEMKGDMSGGAAVIAAMSAIAQLKPKINVMGLIPATENLSGGSATKPGDIVWSITGKSIEIENTDAEGRLVLADAIGNARIQGQRRLIDVATLTGAAVIALGTTTSAVMGNNQSLINHLLNAGKSTGEQMWQLPLFEEYKELNKSKVADLKNTGGREAGSITAACFLSEFAEDTPWVHMDIAGTARTNKTKGYLTVGSTGVAVRSLVYFTESLANESS